MMSKLSSKGINLNNSKYKDDHSSLDEGCEIQEINKFSKSYINHLFKSNEMLGMIILSIYNIWFMNKFFEEIRKSINENKFEEYKSSILSNLVK